MSACLEISGTKIDGKLQRRETNEEMMLLFALGVMVCAFVGVQMVNAEQTMPSSQKSPAATSGSLESKARHSQKR